MGKALSIASNIKLAHNRIVAVKTISVKSTEAPLLLFYAAENLFFSHLGIRKHPR